MTRFDSLIDLFRETHLPPCRVLVEEELERSGLNCQSSCVKGEVG